MNNYKNKKHYLKKGVRYAIPCARENDIDDYVIIYVFTDKDGKDKIHFSNYLTGASIESVPGSLGQHFIIK